MSMLKKWAKGNWNSDLSEFRKFFFFNEFIKWDFDELDFCLEEMELCTLLWLGFEHALWADWFILHTWILAPELI